MLTWNCFCRCFLFNF